MHNIALKNDASDRLHLYTRLIEEANLAQSENEVFQIAARYSAQILNVDRCSIALLDASGDFFDVVALDGQTGAIPLGIKLPREGTLLGEVVEKREVVIVNDAFQTDYLDLNKLREAGAAFMDAPLISGGQIIGTLNSMRKEAGSFDEEDRTLILQVAALLASNIEGRRLFERVQENLIQTERYAERQNELNNMAKQLEMATTKPEIYRIVTEHVNRLLPAKRVSIALVCEEDSQLQVVAISGKSLTLPEGSHIAMTNSLIGKAVSERRIVNLPDILDEQAAGFTDAQKLNNLGIKSCLCAPLTIEDRIIGTVNVAHTAQRAYSIDDEVLLYHIASFTAMTLDNLTKSQELEQRAQELTTKNEALTKTIQALDQRAAELRKTLEENKEILGITAHDLKNPLGGIIGLANLVLEDLEEEADGEAVLNTELIRKEALRMLSIIQSLLDRHRAEHVDTDAFERFDLTRSLQSVLMWNRPQAESKKMTFECEAPPTAPVLASAPAIERAMDNLISNAVKYSPPGSHIKICIEEAGPDNERWRFSVHDEGPGLTSMDRQKVFGKMCRLTAKPTAGEHSSGLGLYIVKQVIEQHEGLVGVESIHGQGATFWFELPGQLLDQ